MNASPASRATASATATSDAVQCAGRRAMQREDADHLVEDDDRRREHRAGPDRTHLLDARRATDRRARGRSRCRRPRPFAARAARGSTPAARGEPASSRLEPALDPLRGDRHVSSGLPIRTNARCAPSARAVSSTATRSTVSRSSCVRNLPAIREMSRSRSSAFASADDERSRSSASAASFASDWSRRRSSGAERALLGDARERDDREHAPLGEERRVRDALRACARSTSLRWTSGEAGGVVDRERRTVEHGARRAGGLVAQVDRDVVPGDVDAVAPRDRRRWPRSGRPRRATNEPNSTPSTFAASSMSVRPTPSIVCVRTSAVASSVTAVSSRSSSVVRASASSTRAPPLTSPARAARMRKTNAGDEPDEHRRERQPELVRDRRLVVGDDDAVDRGHDRDRRKDRRDGEVAGRGAAAVAPERRARSRPRRPRTPRRSRRAAPR